ncbi:hypothetical protein [Rhodomicrobium lacus]|nr:hypothetical protein [Rhodomicrobium lacus]
MKYLIDDEREDLQHRAASQTRHDAVDCVCDQFTCIKAMPFDAG